MQKTCRLCSTQPRGLVAASAGLMVPEMCLSFTMFRFCHSCIAKCWMSMCRARGVGLFSLIIAIATSLSTCSVVGAVQVNPSSSNTIHRYLTVFTAVTVAMNLALVLLVLPVAWSLDL